MTLPFPHTGPVAAAVAGGGEAPVNRVFCVGRNYAAHAREMGRDPDREPPFFFTKWASAVIPSGRTISYPPATKNYHFEVDLCLLIGTKGRDITRENAEDHVYGYCVRLDMTRRDLQLEARAQGRLWDTGKNFDESAPLGLIHKASDIGHPQQGAIGLTVNGEVKQEANLADLIWPVPDIITYLSSLCELRPGDLIMTGTPAGVGPVGPGDHLVGTIGAMAPVELRIA